MALLRLRDIYKSKGKEFIKSLFNSYVIVSEKIDGSRFMFQKQFDDNIIFYKKAAKPINRIDRTLMQFYEKAINYVENLPLEKLDQIPDNWTFGFQYFPSLNPIHIVYDHLPKNHLILTDISVRNDAGRVIKVINDPKVLSDWSEILGVEKPPIIYSGRLNDQQKEKIRSFLDTSEQDLKSLFKAQSFTRYIISVLNPGLKKTALSNSLDNDIDGIVFKFIKSSESDFYSAKLVDPVLYHAAKELKSKNPRKANDMYQIAMLDIVEFLEQQNFDRYTLAEKDQEARYVELISLLFNEYVATNGHKYVGVDFDVPDFAKKPEFNVNLNFIKNSRTKELLDNDYMKNLYKIILSSFRKYRKNSTDILTDTVISSINNIVDKIESKVLSKSDSNKALDFESFLNSRRYQNEDSMFESEIFEALTIDHEEPGNRKVNIIAGRFQPFTDGHLKVMKQLHKKNGLPIVVLIVKGKKSNKEKNPFDAELQLSMFASLQKQFKFLEAAYTIPTAAIDVIFNQLRPAYEPVLWGVGTDRIKAYQYQIDRYRDQLNALPELSTEETKRTGKNVSATKVRNALAIEDRKSFQKMTPKSIHKFYGDLRIELEKAGIIAENSYKNNQIISDKLSTVKNIIKEIKESINNDLLAEDIDSAFSRLEVAINTIDVIDPKAETKIEDAITSTTEFIENFKPISDIQRVFVDEKGFSEEDFTRIINVLKKDKEESLVNLSKYLEKPYDVSYFKKIDKPTTVSDKLAKDIGVNSQTLRHIFNMDGTMKGGKGVGRGELFLGLMIDGASNASVGDVNVKGDPYEVKAIDARLNTQNGFGNGKAAILAFNSALKKYSPELAKKYEVKSKTDVANYNFRSKTESILYKILHEDDVDKNKLIDLIVDNMFTGGSGIWPNSNGTVISALKKTFKKLANNKYSSVRDEFNYEMMYNNILYYQSQEYFNGIFLINNKTGKFAYFDVKSDGPKWLSKYTKYTQPSFQDNPTSNSWKITLK